MSAELLYPLIGGSLSALGAALLLWSLFRDRSRGRLRCPRCWYRMEGVPETKSADQRIRTCPECGRISTSERQLRRTRRRRRWAAVALVLLISGWGVWKFPQARARGLWSYAPTTALILVRDLAYNYGWGGSEIGAELLQRVYDGKVSSWQLAKIDPPGLRDMIGLPSRFPGEDLVWPEGEPLLVNVEPPWFFKRGSEARALCIERDGPGAVEDQIQLPEDLLGVTAPSLEQIADDSESRRDSAGRRFIWRASGGSWLVCPVFEMAASGLGDYPRIVRWTLRGDESVVWSGESMLPLRTVARDGPELELSPVRHPGMDALIRDHLRWGVDASGQRAAFRLGGLDNALLREINLAVRVQLHRDGAKFAELRLLAESTNVSEWLEVNLPVHPLVSATPLPSDLSRWSVRVCADLGALVYFQASGPYWDGDITIPLSEILAREPGPASSR